MDESQEQQNNFQLDKSIAKTPGGFLVRDGKEFYPAADVARDHGYAKDHVTRLARQGRVDAIYHENQWYVVSSSLAEHRRVSDANRVIAAKNQIVPYRLSDNAKSDDSHGTDAPGYTKTKAASRRWAIFTGAAFALVLVLNFTPPPIRSLLSQIFIPQETNQQIQNYDQTIQELRDTLLVNEYDSIIGGLNNLIGKDQSYIAAVLLSESIRCRRHFNIMEMEVELLIHRLADPVQILSAQNLLSGI